MEKILFCEKDFLDEEKKEFKLTYWLLILSARQERVYGAAVEKSDAAGICERDAFCGLSKKRKEAEQFLRKISAATALPVELAALCDDFISEQEWLEQESSELAVS